MLLVDDLLAQFECRKSYSRYHPDFNASKVIMKIKSKNKIFSMGKRRQYF